MKKTNTIALVLLLLLVSGSFYGQNVKLMTYNIRLDVASDGENAWPNRKDYFNSQIRFYSPDIFGIQEALPNQVVDIALAFQDYDKFGIGREEKGTGEACTIYYKKDRFQVQHSNTFWLSETPTVVSRGWDAACNRVCTYGLFKDLKTKKMFWVFNLHLDHMGEVARVKGVELVLSKIKEIKEINTKNYPVFLMGDFNSEPNTKQIKEIKKVMDDTREVSKEKPFGPSGTFNDFKHNEPVTLLLDYIFISKNSGLKIQKHAVLSDSKDLRYPSDHLPVLIEID